MSFEFNEPVREAAKFSNHLLDEAERHEEVEDIAGSFEPLDGVISELEAALSEARTERENLESRVEDVRKVLGSEVDEPCEADYGDDYGDEQEHLILDDRPRWWRDRRGGFNDA